MLFLLAEALEAVESFRFAARRFRVSGDRLRARARASSDESDSEASEIAEVVADVRCLVAERVLGAK